MSSQENGKNNKNTENKEKTGNKIEEKTFTQLQQLQEHEDKPNSSLSMGGQYLILF